MTAKPARHPIEKVAPAFVALLGIGASIAVITQREDLPDCYVKLVGLDFSVYGTVLGAAVAATLVMWRLCSGRSAQFRAFMTSITLAVGFVTAIAMSWQEHEFRQFHHCEPHEPQVLVTF